MKNFLCSLILGFSFISLTSAQFDYGCDGERYVVEVLDNIVKEEVLYGRNVLPDGDSTDLFMDVFYAEVDDADARPVIILAHGGAFIGGNRNEMNSYCNRFAKLGYVAVTIDYRLLNILNGIPDSTGSMDIALKASHDMKAAIRYMKHSATADNPYNIDGNMMFIGGYSAGAITALLAGTIDETDITQDFILDVVEANGGLEGNSGNPDYLVYDTEVQGILNFSGAIYDTTWIDANDPVIQSFHGTNDGTVGYGKAFATVFGIQIISLHGSGNIIQRTENLGVPGYLYTVEGGDHGDIYLEAQYEADRNAFTGFADTTFAEIICGTLVDVFEEQEIAWNIFPNPAVNQLNIAGLQQDAQVNIYDQSGRKIYSSEFNEGANVDLSQFSAGIYSCQLRIGEFQQSKSFVIIK